MCLLVAFNEKEIIDGQELWVGYKLLKDALGSPWWNRQERDYKLDCLTKDIAEYNLNPEWFYSTHKISYKNEYDKIGSSIYKSGFHIFLNKEDCFHYFKKGDWDADKHKVCRVLFTDILSIGLNGDNHMFTIPTLTRGLCVIAQRLYIKSEDWKNAEPCFKE